MSFIKDQFFGGAEKKAGEARAGAIGEGIDEISRASELTAQELLPFLQAGQRGLGPQLDFLGINGRDAQQTAFDNFLESPGQAFLRERGERAVLRNASALGGLGGGNVLKGLQEHGIGTAAQQLGEHQDRLAGLTGLGADVGLGLGGIRANNAGNIALMHGARGDAIAQGITGRATGIRRGVTGLGQILSGLS